MTFSKGFAISVLSFALSASASAMARHDDYRGHDRDNGAQYHSAAYRDHDHDRDDRRPNGWDRGHKNGWKNGSRPPGQARKHDRDWRSDRDREWRREHDRDRHRARHHRRDWDDRDHRISHPMPVGTKPVSQQDRNRAWANNVRARKAEQESQKH